MAFRCRICCGTITVVIGIAMVVAGVVFIGVFERLIHGAIVENVVLKNDTDSFETWKDPPVPVYMQFWVFDLQNKDEVLAGKKPLVKQKGPYTYREIRPKSDIRFYDNGTLSYRMNKSYVFVREKSAGPQNESITTVNLLYATIAEKFQYSSGATKFLLNTAFKATAQSLFQNYTVHDLIWGYRIEALKDLADFIHFFSPGTVIPYDIGLFADINGTDDGTYTIFTGSKHTDRLNLINLWKGQRYLTYWTTPHCNLINGTDGTAYHPFIDKSETLYVFSSDLCRSIYIRYVNDVTMHGVKLYRFTPPAKVFANHTVNPENIGFCAPNCLDAGVLNISSCKGAPVIMSSPHFYQAADKYKNAILGLHAVPDEHRTVLDIEPHTGLVLNAAKRLQINVYIKNIPDISDLEHVPPLTIYPLAWVNESASLDEASANKFKSQVMTPILITHIVQYGLIALGSFLLLIVVLVTIRDACVSKRDVILVDLGNARTYGTSDGNIQYDKLEDEQ